MTILEVYRRPDGGYSIMADDPAYHAIPGCPYAVKDDDEPLLEMVEAYLAEHPEALVPEPVPPEPTAEEREAQRVAGIRSSLAELDAKAIRPLRAIMAKVGTIEDEEALTAIEAEAATLRESL